MFASAGACLAAGVAGAVISARSDAGRWGGRTFAKSFARNTAYAVAGAGAGKGMAKIYQGVGAASVKKVTLSYGVGRRVSSGKIRMGYKVAPKWTYRPSYYVHSAKVGATMTYYQNRKGF